MNGEIRLPGDGAHNRLCACGCGEYVEQDENNTTRYHFSDECAWRTIQASERERAQTTIAPEDN